MTVGHQLGYIRHRSTAKLLVQTPIKNIDTQDAATLVCCCLFGLGGLLSVLMLNLFGLVFLSLWVCVGWVWGWGVFRSG